MATVYEVEIVSHWVNYPKEILEELMIKALREMDGKVNNEIQVKVKTRS